MFYGEGHDRETIAGSNRSGAGEAKGQLTAREAPTVTVVLARAAEVSKSVVAMHSQASELASRLERLVSNLSGPLPPDVGADAKTGPAPREAGCAIEALFQSVDDLDPQVNALRSPLTRIAQAILRLDHVLG